MKNSLIVLSILVAQAAFSTSSALASVEPYLKEVRNYEEKMTTLQVCSTRQLFVETALQNGQLSQITEIGVIALNKTGGE